MSVAAGKVAVVTDRRDHECHVGRAVGEQPFATATPFPVEIAPAVLVTARWRR
jgi:hypothetical protein